PAIRGGILAHGDHQVETRLVVAALIEACERTGVAIIRDRVASVDPDTGARTATVGLASGDAMSCAEVVVAAGCWSAAIDGFGPDVVIPVRPVKGQILRLRMPAGLPALARNVLCVVAGSKCYVVPRRDGRVVVGATVEERGFDTDVTAGPVYELLRDSSRILPSVLEMSLLEANAGLRPGSPDNLPMVGRLGAAMVATGHYRNGILLAPVTAQLVVGALIGRDETDPTLVAAASVLDPRRFASRSATSTAPGGTGA
ncbi:MAG TPA: FAD-dependent oxidoreductase, partial [Acidimicrobiales bacterium]|nr:FAD-dependent oxidoreductase [Acidimicrobiales bacterium]